MSPGDTEAPPKVLTAFIRKGCMIRALFFITFFLPQSTEAVVAYKEPLYANTKELAMLIVDGNDYQKKMLKEYAADWSKYGNIDFVFYDEMPKDGVHYKIR